MAQLEEAVKEAKKSDNKTAHTQVIELSFDPSAYFEEALEEKKKSSEEKKISLKRVLEDQDKQSKYQSSNEALNKIITLAVLFTVLVCISIFLIIYYVNK